jgi:hypothetical protein
VPVGNDFRSKPSYEMEAAETGAVVWKARTSVAALPVSNVTLASLQHQARRCGGVDPYDEYGGGETG